MTENSSFHQSLTGRDTIFRGCLISFFMSYWKGMRRGPQIPDLPSQRGPVRCSNYMLANQSSVCISLSFQLIFLSLQLSVLLYVPIHMTKCIFIIAVCTALSELWNRGSQGEWALNLHNGWQTEHKLQRNVWWFHPSWEPSSSAAALVFPGLCCVITRMQRNRGYTKETQSPINIATDCTEWPDRASFWLWFIMSRKAVTWPIIRLVDCAVLFLPQWFFLLEDT